MHARQRSRRHARVRCKCGRLELAVVERLVGSGPLPIQPTLRRAGPCERCYASLASNAAVAASPTRWQSVSLVHARSIAIPRSAQRRLVVCSYALGYIVARRRSTNRDTSASRTASKIRVTRSTTYIHPSASTPSWNDGACRCVGDALGTDTSERRSCAMRPERARPRRSISCDRPGVYAQAASNGASNP